MAPDDLSPARLAERLAPYRPVRPNSLGRTRRAAVAAIIRYDRGLAEVLLIERAVNAEDRWSGHVSFPGGHWEEHDVDLLATAVRETREEVGLELARDARLIGVLREQRAAARGRILPMTITPFVFHLLAAPVITLGDEAAGSFWLPLGEAASGALDGTYEYRLGPVPLRFPCWRFEGRVVWGLTYQMLRGLLETAARVEA